MYNNSLFGKKIVALMLMILSLFSAMPALAVTPNNNRLMWKVFAPQGSGFSVRMPGQPVKKVDAVVTQYSCLEEMAGRKYFYGVAHQEYQSVPVNVEETLRTQCNDFAKGFKGQIVKRVAVTKNGYRGVIVRVESPDNTAVFAVWLVNRRVYGITFATHKTTILPDEARQFIDSLALTGN